jgi:catechol 2,3-dioxygenase-like lactoylglutathione lyase family enzyme
MSSDVERSLQFFARLGFRERFRDRPVEPRYASTCRDDVQIHLQWNEPQPNHPAADRPVYRFLVPDLDALYAELGDRGSLPPAQQAASPWAAPANTPWGTREFHLRDPDGNGLQFYRALASDQN